PCGRILQDQTSRASGRSATSRKNEETRTSTERLLPCGRADDNRTPFRGAYLMNLIHSSRETWLFSLSLALRPMFDGVGKPIPSKIRVACGWPSRGALSRRQRTIGQ